MHEKQVSAKQISVINNSLDMIKRKKILLLLLNKKS